MTAARLAPSIALLAVLLVLAYLLLTAHPARGRHGAAQDPRGTHGHPTPRKPVRGHTDTANTEGEPNR